MVFYEKKLNVKLIKNYIKKNKLSQKEFCELCGISVGTLKRIKHEVALIAEGEEGFGCDLGQFVESLKMFVSIMLFIRQRRAKKT